MSGRADRATVEEPAPRIAKRPAPLPPGHVLRDRYEIAAVIGRGGMSTVYRAVDRLRLKARSPRPTVALKVVNTGTGIDEDMVQLMHREARRVQDLVHPNIVRIYDWDTDGEHDFMVMEFLEGRTLGAILRETPDQPLAMSQVLTIVRAVGAGLAYAHANDVVHADLKPGNVFLTSDGTIKLLDFGNSRRIDASYADSDDPTVVYHGRVGALTPAYASWEMLSQLPPTPTDDVYSLAVLTYLIVSGRHPFDRATAQDAMERKLRPMRPKGLGRRRWRALRNGLALEQAHRTPTVEQFVREFAKRPLLARLFGG